jgi:hypothetical protein
MANLSFHGAAMKTALWCMACATLAACGESGVGTGAIGNISGNWYLIDPSAPPAAGQVNEIGLALHVSAGNITGNATVAITTAGHCNAYGQELPLTGTIDDQGHLTLFATDHVDSLTVSATLTAGGTAFVNGSYRATGTEGDPLPGGGAPCKTAAGKLNGYLLQPINATYTGALTNGDGASVQVSVTPQQDTVPLTGPWDPPPVESAYIMRQVVFFPIGGFFVAGTMQLAQPVCGMTTGTIPPKEGYVWGTVMQIEFETDDTNALSAVFSALVDPRTGNLNVVDATVYGRGPSGPCSVANLTGTLARQ